MGADRALDLPELAVPSPSYEILGVVTDRILDDLVRRMRDLGMTSRTT